MCLFKNFMSGNIIDFLRLKSIKTTKTFDSSNFTVLIDLPNFYSKFSMKKKTLQQTFIAPSFNLNAWKFLRYKFFAAIFLFNQLLMLIYVKYLSGKIYFFATFSTVNQQICTFLILSDMLLMYRHQYHYFWNWIFFRSRRKWSFEGKNLILPVGEWMIF